MTRYRIAALALAGALALTATSASAQWGRHGGYWGAGIAGFAAGALIGSAIAARPYYYGPAYPGYYGRPAYYGGPIVYGGPVAYGYGAPVVVAAPYGYYGYGYYGYRGNCGGSYGQRRDCAAGDTGR